MLDYSQLWIGFPTAGSIRPEFFASILRVVRLAPDASVTYTMSSRLAHNRNELAHQFIASGREWMLTIDDDMMFDAEQVLNGIALAAERGVSVLGALAFGDDGGQVFSTVMVKDPSGSGGYLKAGQWPENAIQKVDATGTALLLVHRQAMLDIAEQFKDRHPHQWFEEDIRDGLAIGEDVTFCERAKAAGYDIYVHTGIKTGHVKERILTENAYQRQQNFERFIVYGPAADADRVWKFMNALMIPVAKRGLDPRGWRGITLESLDYLPPGWHNAAVIDAKEFFAAEGEDRVTAGVRAARLAGAIRPADRVRGTLKALGMI